MADGVAQKVRPVDAPCLALGVGVTINSGAIATGSPGVTLTIREPSGATGVRISNDGGFNGVTTQAIRGDDTYSWTLASSGGERLPKTVYVRPAATSSHSVLGRSAASWSPTWSQRCGRCGRASWPAPR